MTNNIKKIICKFLGHKDARNKIADLAILGKTQCDRCGHITRQQLTQKERDDYELEFYGLTRRPDGSVTRQ